MSADAETRCAGRVIVCWPRPGRRPLIYDGQPVLGNMIRVTDAATGEDMTGILALRLSVGDTTGFEPGAMSVELTEVLGEDGKPVRGTGWKEAFTPEYQAHRDTVREHLATLGGDLLALTNAEVEQLSALERTYTGPVVQSITSTYLVAEMRLQDPADDLDPFPGPDREC